MKFNIHGTYPYDSGRWERVTHFEISAEELESHLGIRLDLAEKAALKKNNLYLWLNKGYIILNPGGGIERERSTNNTLSIAMMEMMCEGEVGQKWPVGTRAAYLHDGRYSIIEKIK